VVVKLPQLIPDIQIMNKSERNVFFKDLGSMDFKSCWEFQEKFFNFAVESKLHNRQNDPDNQITISDYLFFVEHNHVYTLGKSGDIKNLLLNEAQLDEVGASFYPINRGGDITYHGPGQLVGYPIFDLDHFFTDIHKYLRYLEEAIILTLDEYGILAGRIDGLTGVWIDPRDNAKARKIAALGVKCSRWVTMHGFAFNVNTDLSYFQNIIPCGIDDKAVTSMQEELGIYVNIGEVKTILREKLQQIFGMKLSEMHGS
jgi:lipoyl(octanoyl) transferase